MQTAQRLLPMIIDTAIVIDSLIVDEVVTYDTLYPVTLSSVFDNSIIYNYGTDYTIASETGTLFITNPELILDGEFVISYRFSSSRY